MSTYTQGVAALYPGLCASALTARAGQWYWRALFPQSFALAVAKLCVGSCKALRWRLQCFASEMGKTGTEIVSPILIREKGRQALHTGHCGPQISAEPLVLFAKQSLWEDYRWMLPSGGWCRWYMSTNKGTVAKKVFWDYTVKEKSLTLHRVRENTSL